MRISRGIALLLLAVVGLPGLARAQQDESRVEAGPSGFALSSPDGDWRLRLRGLLQVDGRIFADESAPSEDNEWLLRRVRPSFEGDFGDRVSFRLIPDFGGGKSEIVDAWIDTRLGDRLTLRAGKFKPPVGLERLQSASDLRLVERSFVTELVPKRDVGVQLSGRGQRITWQAGMFNGVNDGGSGDQDDDGNQELAARVFAEPLNRSEAGGVLGLGFAVTHGARDGTAATPLLSGYRSPGQNTVFGYRGGSDGTFADGYRTRVSPQIYWYRGPVGFLGEWAGVSQDVSRIGPGFERSESLEHEAWQITGEWFVTGEAAGYRDPGTVGAVQLVARVAELNIDERSFIGGEASFADPASAVRRARTWGIGVNWVPIAGLKASLAYQHTSFNGGASSDDRPDEKVLLMRLQHRF